VATGVSLANKNVKMAIVENGESLTIDTSSLTADDVLHIPGNAGDAFTIVVSGTSYAIAFDVSGNMTINGGSPLLPGSQFVLDRTYTVVARGSSGSVIGSVPDAPTGVSATAGNGQATVSWTAPVSNGGYVITAYTVTASPGGATADVSGTSATVTGLTNGTAYTFTVVAKNAVGSSVASAPSTAVTPTAPPSGDGSGAVVPCFFGNARVLTPSGYRRMDSLAVGDRVVTPTGTEVGIEKVKVTKCPAGPNTNPYVIPDGCYGATHRVLISPDHKVCLPDGRRVEAKRLGLVQEAREGELTYYNLELTGQADMIVSGVPVESLAPVRRVVVSLATFEAAMKSRYGSMTPAVLANIKRTCRRVGQDAVEVPVLANRR
jgi:hypothetical protein